MIRLYLNRPVYNVKLHRCSPSLGCLPGPYGASGIRNVCPPQVGRFSWVEVGMSAGR